MSYDLDIYVKVKDIDKLLNIDSPEYRNPTCNLGEMFRASMGWDFKQGKIYNCAEIIKNVEQGIRELKLYPEKYREYEPSNGWGTLESAIEDLESLRDCIYKNAEDVPVEHLWMSW